MELKSLSTAIFSGRPPNRLRPGARSRVTRVLNLRDVATRLSSVEGLEEIEVPDTDEARKLEIAAGDVVLTARGSSVRAAVAEVEHQGVLLGANLVAIRPLPALGAHMLAAYMRHPLVQARLLADFAGSATGGFTTEALRTLELSPPEEGSGALEEMAQAVEVYAAHLEAAAALRRQAIVQVAFDRLGPASDWRPR